MKKLISIICLTFLFVCGYGQTRLSYKWEDTTRNLYYRSASATTYTYSENCHTYTGTCCPYAINSNADTCMIVYPSYGTSYVSGLCMPYKKLYSSSSAGYTFGPDYEKPQGCLNIPFYSFATANCSNYKTVTRICDQAFSGCTGLTTITIPSTIKRIDEMFIFDCTSLDTIVFNNTFNQDMIYPPLMNSETWFIDHHITIVVPCNSYDTFYNYIHSLGAININMINIIPDNICDCGAYAIDTVQAYDTTQVVDTIYTTEVIYDTVQVVETIYDTVNIYDTITTNVVNVHHVYDTTFVHDTITHTQYFIYYDTTSVTVYDTIPVQVYDTTVVLVNDTNTVSVYDTITETITYIYEVYDTNYVTIYDTLVINVYDTIYTTIYDTVFVFKQINETFDDLRLYPVPTRDYVNVDYTGGHLEYKLFNNRGKYLESGEVTLYNTVDMTKYATGEYYFRARLDNGEVITKKIVKVSM